MTAPTQTAPTQTAPTQTDPTQTDPTVTTTDPQQHQQRQPEVRAAEGGMSAYFDGWGHGLLFRGHDLDPSALVAALDHDFGYGDRLQSRIEPMWLSMRKRVKWCERYDSPCDMNGEWHSHWASVRPAPGFEWTFAYYTLEAAR